jgi:hypothetical protein
MPYFADGSSYSFMDGEAAAINIGWLGAEHPFPVGEPSDAFMAALARLCRHSVRRTRGYQYCQLCPASQDGAPLRPARAQDQDGEFSVGSAEIRVRAPDGVVFAAPNLIIHYVTDHKYRPPEAFHDAVLSEASLLA